jgi:oxygen-independent coproporphyrinogen-3 oxidase
MNTIPISLYIHLPWCVRKCPYCDFNSYVLPQDFVEDQYIDALIEDFRRGTTCRALTSLHSIFIGGGTPSLFSAQAIDKLLNNIHKLINFKPNIEITMEINPGTCNQQKLIDLHAAGINRLSIGVQSFQNDKLKNLGRIHDKNAAINIIKVAQQAKFTNLNFDLMHGLPQQTCQDALDDLRMAVELQPTHISWYQLTIEEHTPFGRKPPSLPTEETILAMQSQGISLLAEAGFKRYEISNYCKNGYECQHNLNYWQFGDYLAIGAGAHGKITDPETKTITRYCKPSDPVEYIQSCRGTARRAPTKAGDKTILEFMLNALRLTEGVPVKLFTERTGMELADIRSQLKNAINQGFIADNAERIKPTSHGQQFLNQCLNIFCT